MTSPSRWSLRTWTLAFAVVLALVAVVGRGAGGPRRCDGAASMISFELAGNPTRARAVLDDWRETSGLSPDAFREGVRRAIWVDAAFIPIYVAAMALACLAVAVAAGDGSPRLARAARAFACAQPVPGLLDYVENYALARMVAGPVEPPWPGVAAAFAWPKFGILAVTALFLAVAVVALVARRVRRPPESWSLPLLLATPLGNWLLSYPVLVATAALLLGVVWRVVLDSLGIPDLFWHEGDPGSAWPTHAQFLAGLGAGLLAVDLGLVGFLLDAPQPWMARFAHGAGFPHIADKHARALVCYLLATSAVIAGLTIASVAVAGVPDRWPLPAGVLSGGIGYAGAALLLWRRSSLPMQLLAVYPHFVKETAQRARLDTEVGGPELDGLAGVLMVLRVGLLTVLIGTGLALRAQVTVPPALGICLLLSAVAALYGFLVFFFPARRFGLVAAVVVLWVAANNVGGPDHPIPELSYDVLGPRPGDVNHVPPTASGLADDNQVLQDWLATSGTQGPLIVVAADGGGVRAATWAMSVLTRLEEDFDGRFPAQVRLVTGASGGMLGAAYYVAALERPADPPSQPRQPRGPGGLGRAELMRRVSRDSLTPTASRLVLHDLIPGLTLTGFDRGDAIQEAWARATDGVLERTVRSLQAGETEGWRPSLVLSPMIVEDGRRLLISNLDLDDLATQAAPQRYLGRGALQFGRLFRDAAALRLGTAVRMSATFPFVMPALELPTRPRLRLVDAGYYDEHGVNLAGLWLLDHAEALKKQKVPRVILIEVPDALASLKKHGPCNDRPSWIRAGLVGLTTPPEGVLSGRDALSAHGNDELLEAVAAALNTEDAPDRFQSIAFEPPYPTTECGGCARPGAEVPLSWYIRSEDRDWLEHAIDGTENRAKRAELCRWWFEHRPPAEQTTACADLVRLFPRP
jgi:hypothetical protein